MAADGDSGVALGMQRTPARGVAKGPVESELGVCGRLGRATEVELWLPIAKGDGNTKIQSKTTAESLFMVLAARAAPGCQCGVTVKKAKWATRGSKRW